MKVIKKNINNFSIFQNITEDKKTKIIINIGFLFLNKYFLKNIIVNIKRI